MSLLNASEIELRDWMRILADSKSSPEAVMFAQENIRVAFRQLIEANAVVCKALAEADLREATRARLRVVRAGDEA